MSRQRSSGSTKLKNAGLIIGTNIFPLLFALSCIIPIIWIFLASLKTMNEFSANPVSLPQSPSFAVYQKIFTESDLFMNILNSVWNTVISVFFVLIIGFINGYFLARFKLDSENSYTDFTFLNFLFQSMRYCCRSILCLTASTLQIHLLPLFQYISARELLPPLS